MSLPEISNPWAVMSVTAGTFSSSAGLRSGDWVGRWRKCFSSALRSSRVSLLSVGTVKLSVGLQHSAEPDHFGLHAAAFSSGPVSLAASLAPLCLIVNVRGFRSWALLQTFISPSSWCTLILVGTLLSCFCSWRKCRLRFTLWLPEGLLDLARCSEGGFPNQGNNSGIYAGAMQLTQVLVIKFLFKIMKNHMSSADMSETNADSSVLLQTVIRCLQSARTGWKINMCNRVNPGRCYLWLRCLSGFMLCE